MSDEVLAILLTLAILAGLFAWVPTLHFCGDRCQRYFGRRKTQQKDSSL